MFGPHVTGPVVSSPAVIGTVLAEGANGFIGHSALIIGFAACLFAALGLVAATTTHNPRLLRAVQSYGWLALVGAVLAITVMVRALVTRDWSLAYVQKVWASQMRRRLVALPRAPRATTKVTGVSPGTSPTPRCNRTVHKS